jgi:hypothetical protein
MIIQRAGDAGPDPLLDIPTFMLRGHPDCIVPIVTPKRIRRDDEQTSRKPMPKIRGGSRYIRRNEKRDDEDAILASLKVEGPASLSPLAKRTGIAPNRTKNALNRLCKLRRIEKISPRIYAET